jgi:AAA+ ATPase superfamily predicted ATPase
MELSFVNRTAELKELDAAAAAGGLLVFFGRRRVGKTRLLAHWLARHGGLYSQAIESASEIQLDQTYRDLQPQLTTTVTPKSWAELLEILGLQKKKRWILCLDEFPYLVNSDPSLPSVLQRWLDHSQPKQSLLLLSGSSTRMMNDLFLNRSAPLYGRARKLVHVRPMSYAAFCGACRLNPADAESFTRFSIVGGIPKYWEFVDPKASAVDLAEALFFGFAPYLDQEPARILRDEGISGLNALSLLEAVGRGAEKPSEIAARLGTAQTNLSRLLQQLLDASILERGLPFGESVRSTKRTQYRIQDPALRFWFRVYSPHRSRWHDYSIHEKQKLLQDHASTVFEDFCRQQFSDAARYWEGNLEFDLVRSERRDGAEQTLIVSEVKWKLLTASERRRIETELEDKWQRSALRHRHPNVAFEVLDSSILKRVRSEPGSSRQTSSAKARNRA